MDGRLACSGCSEVTDISTWPACPLMATQAAGGSDAAVIHCGAGPSEVLSLFLLWLKLLPGMGKDGHLPFLEGG